MNFSEEDYPWVISNKFYKLAGQSFLMVVIFYFLLWRPQKKQQKERTNLLSSLKKGQKIVTIGGIYGEIIELDDEKVKVQVAEKVEMTFARTAIASVVSKKK